MAVIGGLKGDKLTAVHNLLDKADTILMAGAISYNLLKAKGFNIGDSKADDEGMSEKGEMVKEIIENEKVLLPLDAVVASEFSETAEVKTVPREGIEKGWMALDIGPETIAEYKKYIHEAKTILWFGPIGVFEMKPFAKGTTEIGKAIADADAVSIVGGGDSAGAVKILGLEDKMSLVSTGGGASLTMIEGKELPALVILKK